jgi:hypothetical protein
VTITASAPFAASRVSMRQIGGQNLSRSNIVYLVVGALVVVVVILDYQLYQDRKQPEGVRIDVGPNGMSIEKK